MARAENVQKRAEWRKRLQRFSRSKLTVAQFCRREKVSTPTFYHWRRELADASSDVGSQRQTTPATFLPIQVATNTDVHVVFPNGARLRLPVHDHDLVRLTIESVAMAQVNQGGV